MKHFSVSMLKMCCSKQHQCICTWAHARIRELIIPLKIARFPSNPWKIINLRGTGWAGSHLKTQKRAPASAAPSRVGLFKNADTYNILSLIFHPWASVFYLNGELVFQSRRTADCTRVVVKLMPEMHTPSEMQIMLLFRPARRREIPSSINLPGPYLWLTCGEDAFPNASTHRF